MNQTVIEMSGIGKRYGRQWIFSHLDLEVQAGESIALFGGNGSGKSTLIKILSTLLSPSVGDLKLFGEKVSGQRGPLRRRLRLLGHEKQLYRTLTVEENLKLAARIRGVRLGEAEMDKLLERVGIRHRRHYRVEMLSEGLKKRVVLARMILGDADLFLLDEPHPTLDIEGRKVLNDLLHELRSRGKTLVIASHDHDQARALTDRILVIEGGRFREERTGR